MNLLIDMNLTPTWVEFLEEHNHSATHWSSVGRNDAPDTDLLAYARQHQAVILTQDLDFGALLALSGDDLPSVIQVRAQATLPRDIGSQVVDALRLSESYLLAGALVTISPTTHRVSVLPLR